MKKYITVLFTMISLLASGSVFASSTTQKFDVGNLYSAYVENDGRLSVNKHDGITDKVFFDDCSAVTCGYDDSVFVIKKDASLWSVKNGDMPVKLLDNVKQAEAGEGFAIALKNDGTLWAWGEYERGFGGDGEADFSIPQKIFENVRFISCGKQHCAFITNDDKLYTAGNGSLGVLAIGEQGFTVLSGRHFAAENIKTVSCGGTNTYIVDNNGVLYSCGCNKYNQLLNGDEEHKLMGEPQVVVKSGVEKVVCHNFDVAFITKDGELYIGGRNKSGHFGLGYKENVSYDAIKLAENVQDVAIGEANVIYSTVDGKIYVSGRYADGISEECTCFVKKRKKLLTLKIDSDIAVSDENIIKLSAQAVILNDKTYVSYEDIKRIFGIEKENDEIKVVNINGVNSAAIRDLAEKAGYTVEWNNNTRTVDIY